MSIPWYKFEPNQCEFFVSVLLLRQFPNGSRRRPAQGDGGVDVLVPVEGEDDAFDVYQVKYFYSNLTNDQYRQIANSAATLLKGVRAGRIRVRHWHLAMPLDPKEGDEPWLRNLFAGTSIEAYWKGLAHLEGWAAAYPDVVNYYVNQGSDRLVELVNRMLEKLEFRRSVAEGEPISVDTAVRELSSLFSILNQDDPHYRYEFAVMGPGKDYTDLPQGIAMRHVSGDDNSIVVVDVVPLYEEAVLDRPIEGQMIVRIPQADQGLLQEFENFRRYGDDIVLPSGTVETVIDDPVSGLTYSDSMSISLIARPVQEAPIRLRLIVKDGDDSVHCSIPVTVERFTTGVLGGFSVALRSDTGVIRLENRSSPEPGPASTRVDFTASWDGKIASQVLDEVRFAAAVREGRDVWQAGEFVGPLVHLITIAESQFLAPDWLLPYCEALSNLQDFADAELRIIAPNDGSGKYVNEALLADQFRLGGVMSIASENGFWVQVPNVDNACARINELHAIAYIAPHGGDVATVNVSFDDAVHFIEDVRAEKVSLNGVDYISITSRGGGPVTMKIQRKDYFLAADENRELEA